MEDVAYMNLVNVNLNIVNKAEIKRDINTSLTLNLVMLISDIANKTIEKRKKIANEIIPSFPFKYLNRFSKNLIFTLIPHTGCS